MVINANDATTITAAIDGGQPWRRSFGDNITYTDWRKDNFFRAVQQLTNGVKRLGVEFDHISVDYRKQIEDALPGVELVDIAQPAMWMRAIKSPEEHSLIREGARTCNRRTRGDGRYQGRGSRARGGNRLDHRHDPRDRQELPVCRTDGHLDLVPIRHQHGWRP
jgi:hypothetical protein